MKRGLILILLIAALLCTGCAAVAPTEAPADALTEAPTAADSIPAELVGTWSSAHSGELDITESFTFNEDGTLSASAVSHGTQTQTVTGTFTVSGHTLTCEVTGGVSAPYTLVFDYRIDGRELYLTDADGESQFLRTS